MKKQIILAVVLPLTTVIAFVGMLLGEGPADIAFFVVALASLAWGIASAFRASPSR